jgi:hypothetical protein
MEKFEIEMCNEKHKTVDCKINSHQWMFGIIISLQLATFSFTGWLSSKLLMVEVVQSRHDYRIENIEKEINDKLNIILINGQKLDRVLQRMDASDKVK